MLYEIESDTAILSEGTRAYFQDRLHTRLYDLVIKELESYKARGATQAQLAARIGKRADQISRWLSSPGNWTLDTISDLLLGMSGGELKAGIDHPAKVPARNFRRPVWLDAAPRQTESSGVFYKAQAISPAIAPAIVTVDGCEVIFDPGFNQHPIVYAEVR